jgi:hypothetical protein
MPAPVTAPAPAAEDALRRAFRRRATGLLDRLAAEAEPELLERALAEPSDAGALARLLAADVERHALSAVDPLAAAVGRGVAAREAMIARAGGLLPAERLAAILGLSPAAVAKRRQRDQLLAVPVAGRGHAFPAAQLQDGAVLPGLDRVLRAMPGTSGWTRLALLLTPHDGLDGRTPLAALAAGEVEAAVAAAAEFAAPHG